MRVKPKLFGVLTAGALLVGMSAHAQAQRPVRWVPPGRLMEDYVRVPMPAGIHVESTELEGPVFADSRGHTLYDWPQSVMRVGVAGDSEGTSSCTNHKFTESAGLMSPYPAGLVEPDVETRPSCAERWPPALAPAHAQPVGDWSIIVRADGSKQWAYQGYALYTSVFDHYPGDAMGGRTTPRYLDGPPERRPIGPSPRVPPGFLVTTTPLGRMLVNEQSISIYSSDKDRPGHSNCDDRCAQTWLPVVAPQTAHALGDWSVVERSPGVRQWAFRKKPLYIYAPEQNQSAFGSVSKLDGTDVPGWHNVYVQIAPPAPKEFTIQATPVGLALADSRGKTIYTYNCADDAQDQLACDHPDTTQAYRLAICGGGSVERCLEQWPYVLAPRNARIESRSWSVIEIDPKSGHRALPGQAGALRVWAFRDRPVYTSSRDLQPGDVNGDSVGEYQGKRNGFKAIFLRNEFFNSAR